MLATLNDIYPDAQKRRIAVGAFNIVNFENILAVLETAEKLNEPVIMAFAQTHEENHIATLDTMGPVMMLMAEQAKVPVVVHLDHGVNISYIEKALKMGFTSVMFDGSALPYEENVAKTKEAVKLARAYHASIEAEIGKMAGITLNNSGITENRKSNRSNYTDPAEAADFVAKTGVDCLACSFGTVHGEYFSEPNLDFDLVKELSEATNVPIVMHGGSGVSHEDYKKVIANGVRKINYFTYMDKAGAAGAGALKEPNYFHEYAQAGKDAMQKDVESAMRCFTNKDEGSL
ncbi:class II fructose-bisphosphate aldolase [Catenisphaera adipataccumulans]|uniref:Fructose-bisphosphate aldolase class II n=1 Tax=Catenisphaera adipataccumulans TaxID=700500 RepID=A0A7W8FW11_9FIRM|nr:class II fructose-bisphosphate aldolase [Catenisphaera adipataccumulans]MBB5182786.1 fructose-bisphosphate aldolase class II [Catenisphaera adipataccumulans]